MNNYEVVLSLGASATMFVDAESEEEAIQIAQDEFWDDELSHTDVWTVDDVIEVRLAQEDVA